MAGIPTKNPSLPSWTAAGADKGERIIISAKVWRYTGERWSRQSEELPLHRVLDLAILVTRGFPISGMRTATRSCRTTGNPVLERVGLQGDAMTVAVCIDNEKIDEDMKLFQQARSTDDELLRERLAALSRILKDMGY